MGNKKIAKVLAHIEAKDLEIVRLADHVRYLEIQLESLMANSNELSID